MPEARPESDIDLRIDKGAIRGYIQLSSFHLELEDRLACRVDVLTTAALREKFLNEIKGEEVVLYERQPQKH